MGALSLALFTQVQHDRESAQYRILAALQQAATTLHHNKLYPVMGELIEIASVLETVQQNRSQYTTMIPRELTGVDLENQKLVFDHQDATSEDIEAMFELIAWALPQVKALTNESVHMFDFVMQHMQLHVVGIIPMYKDEGYALIPDPNSHVLHILRYQLALFTAHDEQYRSMKTVEVDTRVQGALLRAPEDIKLDLIQQFMDLPNPATFMLDADIDFPFEETLLPVAKRKLMRHLIS